MLLHTGPSCNEVQEEAQQLPDTSPSGGSQQGSGNGATSPQTQLGTSPHFSALIKIKRLCLNWIFSTFSSSRGFLGQQVRLQAVTRSWLHHPLMSPGTGVLALLSGLQLFSQQRSLSVLCTPETCSARMSECNQTL